MATISEKRAMELMDDLHYGRFDEHREWDCAVTAINNKETLEELKRAIKSYQKGKESGRYTEDRREIQCLCQLGEIAAKHYLKLFPKEFPNWTKVMDVPTRCACGRRIARLYWEY